MDAVDQAPEFMSTDRKNRVARIVRESGQKLLRFIRARVSNDAEAEDILQDVWGQLVASLEDGPIEQVGAWLYTVARHRIIDRYRKPRPASLEALAAAGTEDDVLDDLAGYLGDDKATPPVEYARRLFWKQLHAALAELPPEQRQIFVWHELEGLSFQDMVALTGENQNTLLARKRYAVQRLRRRLAPFRDEFLP